MNSKGVNAPPIAVARPLLMKGKKRESRNWINKLKYVGPIQYLEMAFKIGSKVIYRALTEIKREQNIVVHRSQCRTVKINSKIDQIDWIDLDWFVKFWIKKKMKLNNSVQFRVWLVQNRIKPNRISYLNVKRYRFELFFFFKFVKP